MKYCDICGQPASSLDEHHLLLGMNRSATEKSEGKDLLTIHVCRLCHTSIHASAVTESLCKMLGQALYENSYTHEQYMKEFGKNFLPNKSTEVW